MRKKRIGIFGGSFDPVHEGHIHLATLAMTEVNLDEVWFLPCKISPHKTGSPPSSAEKRVAWLKEAIRPFPWAKISHADLEVDAPSYSFQTLENLTAEFPGNDWFWIMGGDQWMAFDRWEKPHRIAELAEVIVLARDGVEIQKRENVRFHVVEGEHPASSTQIRESLEAGQRDIPYLAPPVESMMRAEKRRDEGL